MDVNLIIPLISILQIQQEEIELLKEKAKTNSDNSSTPPSKSFKKKKKAFKKKSDKKIGAQPGHVGTARKSASIEEVNQVIKIAAPLNCPACKGSLTKLNECKRHQIYDLENNQVKITEYNLERAKCSQCRKIYSANLPDDVSYSIFGANLCSIITSLVVNYRLSKQKVIEILKEFYNFDLCVGSVSNIEKRVSNSLEKAYYNCSEKLKTEKVVNADETRHIESGKTQWVWLGASNSVTVYLLGVVE